MERFIITATLPAKPEAVYDAWLDSTAHGAMTGSPARIDSRAGGTFSAWDGYIRGKTIELVPGQKIVQEWRTTEFPQGSPSSRLSLKFTAAKGGTKLTVSHTNIPDGQANAYRQGWKDFYFVPMKEYFSSRPLPL